MPMWKISTSAWCEKKWPKTAAIFPQESNPRPSLLTSVFVRFSRKCHENLSGMRQFTFKTKAAQHHSSTKKSIRFEIGVLWVNESSIRYVLVTVKELSGIV